MCGRGRDVLMIFYATVMVSWETFERLVFDFSFESFNLFSFLFLKNWIWKGSTATIICVFLYVIYLIPGYYVLGTLSTLTLLLGMICLYWWFDF
jgi:hypothetical protein